MSNSFEYPKRERVHYVKNCFWWIEQYFNGNASKAEAQKAIDALQKYIDSKPNNSLNETP